MTGSLSTFFKQGEQRIKTRSRCRVLSLTIASVLVTGIFVTQTALATDMNETVSVTAGHSVSPTEERIMARSAAHVLRRIADARSAINATEYDEAKSDLQQVRRLIDMLKSQQPTARVRDHIWTAQQHLDYDSTEEVAVDMVPIEAGLTEIEAFVPVEKARRHTRLAQNHLKKGDKAGAKKELKAAAAALIYTEVDLPLSGTERQVITAQKALGNNQPAQADKALKQAENSVRVMSSAVEAPVTQARNSFWQASKDYAAGSYAAARAELASASVWLKKATQSTDKTTQKEAGKLKHSLESVRGQMTQASKETGDTLTHLWQRSKALAERESEKASSGWKGLLGESTLKADLMDAKLHLAYAQSAQFVHGQSSEVSSEVSDELDQAQNYLNKAGKTSDKALTTKIDAMSKQLKQLKSNMDDKSAEAHARYDKIKADLRQTIHDL